MMINLICLFSAIEAWVIACIIFVFGALGEYTVILLKLKLTKLYPKPRHPRRPKRNKNPLGPPPGKQKLSFKSKSYDKIALFRVDQCRV